MISNDIAILTFFYPFRILLDFVYTHKLQRPFSLVTVHYVLDLAIGVVFAIRFSYESVYTEGFDGLSAQDQHFKYYENIFEIHNHGVFISVLYSIASGILWLKIVLLMRLSRLLGPLVTTIRFMLYDVASFMTIYGILIIVFSCVGNLLFSDLTAYGDIYHCILTLFDASLGNYDLTLFENAKLHEVVGDVYLISFIILMNILILNLLIAILSTTYAILDERKLVLYINEILRLRNTMDHDKRYSALVSSFSPWNGFVLPFVPFFVVKRDTQTLNRVLLHVEYFPIVVLLTIFFIIGNFLVIPFAYLKGVFLKIVHLGSKRDKGYRLMQFFVFLVFGLGILLYNFVADLIAFWIHMYQFRVPRRKDKVKIRAIRKNTYKLLTMGLRSALKNQKGSTMRLDAVSKMMRERLRVLDLIRAIVYGLGSQNVSSEDILLRIQEYNMVKNVLFRLSYEGTAGERLIDIEQLLQLLEVMVQNARIKKI